MKDILFVIYPLHTRRIAFLNLKIVATAKEVGVLPPEAPQWPNSSSGGCANHVPGDVRWLHKGRLHDDRQRTTDDQRRQKRLIEVGYPHLKTYSHTQKKCLRLLILHDAELVTVGDWASTEGTE